MDPTPNHQPGEQIGPYTLERLLGRGAAAEVWQVVEEGALGFQKRQALKLLRPPPGEMEAQKKALINEARVCGRLKHPGVVDVYRVGDEGGELYIAMEYVDGPDLNTLLVALRKRGIQLPIRASIEAAIDVSEALQYAHDARDDEGELLNIVHRDLKPSNVLVERRGVLKISDWGLVKSTLNIESTTRGIVKGTPGYIAPEVWGGTRDFKPAADLFAVGAMLYEFVVGERLFQGRNLARIAEQVARRKPEEEAAQAGARCPQLVPILTRLLQRSPAARYQDGASLIDELRPILEHHSDEQLRDFLRRVRDVVDEIAPASLTSRMTRGGSPMPPPPDGAEKVPLTDPMARAPQPPAPKQGTALPEGQAAAPPPASGQPVAAPPAEGQKAAGQPADPTVAPPAAEASRPAPPPAPTGGTFPTGLPDPIEIEQPDGSIEGAEGPQTWVPGQGWVQGGAPGVSEVPATRTMEPQAQVSPDGTPAVGQEPATGAGTRPQRRRRRTGQGPRPGGSRPVRRPAPPPRRVPSSKLAVAVAVAGILVLLTGIASVVLVVRGVLGS